MAALDFSLLPWQSEVLNDPTRFKVVVAGRRCGKSRMSAIALLVKGLQCPAGSDVIYIAPTQGQARTIIWRLLLELGKDVIQSSHVNNSEITLINNTIIYVRGADNPDALRGPDFFFAVLDE
jgi:phage terminase large subunit-like protein